MIYSNHLYRCSLLYIDVHFYSIYCPRRCIALDDGVKSILTDFLANDMPANKLL